MKKKFMRSVLYASFIMIASVYSNNTMANNNALKGDGPGGKSKDSGTQQAVQYTSRPAQSGNSSAGSAFNNIAKPR
jgi:hypothetical protein